MHLLGVRDLDPGEEREVEAAGLSAEIPDGVPLYVHLDTDVLDPSVMAAQFPVPDGWDARRLRAQLAELAAGCRIVGVEITALEDLARRRAGRRGDPAAAGLISAVRLGSA